MEYRTAISCIDYCAHYEGAEAACNERDPSTDPGRDQMHTEHPERHHSYQELCWIKQQSTEHNKFQRR